MEKITTAIEKRKAHYDVVVIGSGYGGGVSASRLARAGKTVCVLERGKEFQTKAPESKDFPADMATAYSEMQMDTPKGHIGPKLALYDFKVNDQINALVGCGLGGTSLINANVALELDPKVFREHSWPAPFKTSSCKTSPDYNKVPAFLKKHYHRARHALGSTPYPETYPKLNKLEALKKSAEEMDIEFYRPPINVTFEDGPNAFGFPQNACINCGDCCSGCKYNAKNTTQMNYLPDAEKHGADIFCEVLVERLSKDGGQWLVSAKRQDELGEKFTITAENVIVCAGTFGSTELLLRSSTKSLKFSKTLGNRFSGNGDVIAFGYNSYWKQSKDNWEDTSQSLPIYGIGMGENDLSPEQMPGPCITGIIDNRKTADFKDGRVIEEGVFPGAFASLLPPLFFFADTQYGNFTQYGADQTKARLLDAKNLGTIVQSGKDLAAQSYVGPLSRMQTYLVMSQDDAGGEMYLDKRNNIRVSWKGVGQSKSIVANNDAIREANLAIEGQFVPNLMWSEPVGYQVITVHPLGGCCMGTSAEDGVVNAQCRVFSGEGEGGEGVHEGLYVMDGSVIPGAAGVNPLLTITAITEYAIEEMAKQKGWKIDYEDCPGLPTDEGEPAAAKVEEKESIFEKFLKFVFQILMFIPRELWKMLKKILDAFKDVLIEIAAWLLNKLVSLFPDYFSPSLAFTETMEGYAAENFVGSELPKGKRVSSNFEVAAKLGEAEGSVLNYKLTIKTENLNEFIGSHVAQVTGEVFYKDEKYEVTEGKFILFDPQMDCVETWNMRYDLVLERKGEPYFLQGVKYLHHTDLSHWWDDVTTLYTNLYRGDSASGWPMAKGIIRLNTQDAIMQGNTIKMVLPKERCLQWLTAKFPKVKSLLLQNFMFKFGGFCAEVVFKSYGGLLADMENFPHKENAEAVMRIVNLPQPEITQLPTSDGACITLYRYRQPGNDHPKQVVLAPGFSVTANSFATGTVKHNLVEYLYNGGVPGDERATKYDVWLFAYRASPDSGNTLTDYTIDDIAQIDWPLAIKFIKEQSGAKEVDEVDVVAHCVGSMTLLMSLLKGLEGVGKIVSSQLTLHPVTNWINYLKSDIGLVELIGGGLPDLSSIKEKISMRPTPNNDTSSMLDILCWQVPVPKGEACNNPVCRRVFSIFGPSYTHSQLNHNTHIAMEDWFDEIATKPFEQIELIVEKEYVVSAEGEDIYLPNVHKLEGKTIHFIAGSKNEIFMPETSLRTERWLKAHYPKGDYHRKVFEGYAHMDCFIGKNAYQKIFPYIYNALEGKS